MLSVLAPYLERLWGPFRLFQSHIMLIGMGVVGGAILTFFILPRLSFILPCDRGRPFASAKDESRGKPTGAGLIMMLALLPVLFLVLPPGVRMWQIAVCLAAAMFSGYFDDRGTAAWSEGRKLLLDFSVAFATSLVFSRGRPVSIWLPLLDQAVTLPVWLYLIVAVTVLMVAINATNCSDGVDGLAGTLTLVSLFYLGGFLYAIVGHREIADYLLVPHNPVGAVWAILVFSAAGVLAGYLWYNAEPSSVLMGDAGSRLFGLLVGVAVLASGNPFLIFSITPVVLLNGGTGLVKLLLLRLFKRLGFDVRSPARIAEDRAKQTPASNGRTSGMIALLHRVRFPLHDHCLKNLGWSKPQVLIRFFLLQTFLIPILLVLLVKLR